MSGYCSGLTLQYLPAQELSTLIVALVLADQADQDGGSIFTSVGLIAAMARMSERQVQYSMRDLEQIGFLVCVKKGGGRNNPTHYRIDLDWLLKQCDLIKLFREKRAQKRDARCAPFQKTVHDSDKAKGEREVQEGCTKGAPASAPDPRPLTHDSKNNYSSSGGEDGERSFKLFLSAAGNPSALIEKKLQARLKKVIFGATVEQAKFAGVAVAAAIARGKVGCVEALAFTMAKLAAKGDVTKPSSVIKEEEVEERRNLNKERESLVDKFFQSQDGDVYKVDRVLKGAKAFCWKNGNVSQNYNHTVPVDSVFLDAVTNGRLKLVEGH